MLICLLLFRYTDVFMEKTCDLNFQPNKVRYQSKNYITLKLMRSTIGIFNQPHSTSSVPILYCSLWTHMKYFYKACSMYVHVSALL